MHSMRKRFLISVYTGAAVAMLGLSVSCSSKKPEEPAVATPSLTMSRDRVAIGSPVKLTYKFVVAPGAKIDGDYWVFVHILDPTGEQLWTDDHLPATPTSTWTPGQTVEYTRTVFVPNYPYIGEAAIRLGLYSQTTGRRLTLNGQGASNKEYTVASFQMLPQSENVFVIYKDGWHPAEIAAENAASEWQWTRKTATISFKNPRKDVTFYLDAEGRPDFFTAPQQITLKVNGQPFGTFAVATKGQTLQVFAVTAAQLGDGDMAEIAIETDRTFVAGGGDTRELGLRVFHAFVESK